jgi:NACHT domain
MRKDSGGRTCLEATRGDVLKEIHEWVESDTGRLFWLHGPAGSGKSTLSHTIAEHYSRPNKNLLAASFFFSRDYDYLSNSKYLFQTIAFQLGHQHRALRQAIADAIIEDATILDTKMNQLEKLILDPISKTATFLPSRLVVVIDALDECDSNRAASNVIELLVNSLSSYDAPLPLRFLVTCWPEKHLYDLFITSPNAYHLDLSDVDAEKDISMYIMNELRKLLGSANIDFLVQFSEELFIVALTVIKFLKHSPTLQLQVVRKDGFCGLDALYRLIMQTAMEEVTLPYEQEFFRVVVSTIVLASAWLSLQALVDLLQIHPEIKELVLHSLCSVIHVLDTSSGLVHAFHSLLHGFLIDPKYDKTSWFIDTAKYHGILARSCLEHMMMDQLKKDMCDLQKHTKKNRDADVQEKVKSLPGDLVYASHYWAGHFAKSKQDDSLLALLTKFALEHLLHWIEVLCLLGCLSEGVDALQIVIRSLKVSPWPFQQQRTTNFLSSHTQMYRRNWSRCSLTQSISWLNFTPCLLYLQCIRTLQHCHSRPETLHFINATEKSLSI